MKLFSSLLLTLFILCGSLSAQKEAPQYGITIKGGFGKLRNPILVEAFDTELSASFGLRGQWKVATNGYLGAEFLWLQFAANFQNTSGTFDTMFSISERNKLTFFSIPLYYKHQVNKLGFKFGMQAAVFAFGKFDRNTTESNNGQEIKRNFDGPITKFNNPINYGPKFGVDGKLNDRINLRGDIFYDLSDKFSKDEIIGLHQFTIGVDVNFAVKKNEEE